MNNGVIRTPAVPLDQFGFRPGTIHKIFNVPSRLYVIAYWKPAEVPTRMRPGSWVLDNTAFWTLEEAEAYTAGTDMRILEWTSVEAREAFGMPMAGEP